LGCVSPLDLEERIIWIVDDRRRDDLCAGESRRLAAGCSAVRATIFARSNLVSVLFLFTVKMSARLRGQYS